MDGFLAGLPWDGISGSAIGLLVLFGFFTGRLKTRSDYLDAERRAAEAEEGRRYWQTVAENRSGQMDRILPALDSITGFIEAMVKRSGPDRDGDE